MDHNPASLQPQHQSVITQRHPALAQSLYYGQYALRALYGPEVSDGHSPAYRQQYEKYYEDQRLAEQKTSPNWEGDCERKNELPLKELGKEDSKQKICHRPQSQRLHSTPEPNKNHSKLGPSVPNKTEETGKSQLLSVTSSSFRPTASKLSRWKTTSLLRRL